jgi:ABC-type phosphate transport system substrate-binding protein
MNTLQRLILMAACAAACPVPALADEADAVVVVAHPSVPRLDVSTVQRLYTGRAVEVGGLPVTVVNTRAGSATRQRFLLQYLQQDEEKYRAYWTVRLHVGKGTPPRELAGVSEVIDFVQRTPGAVGYIPASDVRAGLNIVARP